MNDSQREYIGYLKYSGNTVKDGLLDARKSAEALLGFDEVFRYFITQEEPELKNVNFEVPVRIQKGSWEIIIDILIVAYLYNTVKKAATDGLFQTGIAQDIKLIKPKIIEAIKCMLSIVKMRIHIGKSEMPRDHIRFRSNNEEVGIPNDDEEYLWIPTKHFKIAEGCPNTLFSKSVSIIEAERILEIGVNEDGRLEKVSITEKEKHIFYSEDNDGDILFPELEHGQKVELEGTITRENEATNTLGFRYEEHVLICWPSNGKLSDFKSKILSQREERMFPEHAKITGTIERPYNKEGPQQKKPQIIFDDITPIEKLDNQKKLI